MPSKSKSISDVADILKPQVVAAGEPQTQTSIKCLHVSSIILFEKKILRFSMQAFSVEDLAVGL